MASNGPAVGRRNGNPTNVQVATLSQDFDEFKNTIYSWFNPPLRSFDELKQVIRRLAQDVQTNPWRPYELERSPPNLVGPPGRFSIVNHYYHNQVGWNPPPQPVLIKIRIGHDPVIEGTWEQTGRSHAGGGGGPGPQPYYRCPGPRGTDFRPMHGICREWNLTFATPATPANEPELLGRFFREHPLTLQEAGAPETLLEVRASRNPINLDRLERDIQSRNLGRLNYIFGHMNDSTHAVRGAELGLWQGPLPPPVGGPQYLPEQSPIGATLRGFLGGQLPPWRGAQRSRRPKRKARKTQKNRHK